MSKKPQLKVIGTVEMKRENAEKARELSNWYDSMPGWFRIDSEYFHIKVAEKLESFLPESFHKLTDFGELWIFSEFKVDSDKVQIIVQDAATTEEAIVEVKVIG